MVYILLPLSDEEVEYITKDTITCEQCQNVINIRRAIEKKKRGHMLHTDDASWLLLKTEAAAFGQPLGDFIRFLIGFYRAHKIQFSVPEVSEP